MLSRLGIAATFASFEYLEEENPLITPPITVNSNHTKHHLEDLHKGIAVFRHPDHLPDAPNVRENILSSFQNLSLNAASLSKLPTDTVKGLYGIHEGVFLQSGPYWNLDTSDVLLLGSSVLGTS